MGLKHKLTKFRMLWTDFMRQQRGGLNANIWPSYFYHHTSILSPYSMFEVHKLGHDEFGSWVLTMGRVVKVQWVEGSKYHGFWPPPYPWYFDPSIYGILTPLPMVYWTPYPWYIESPTHVIFTSLLKGNVDDKWNIFVVIWPQIFYSDQPSHGGDRGTFEVMTST